jgi:hypothetical protein
MTEKNNSYVTSDPNWNDFSEDYKIGVRLGSRFKERHHQLAEEGNDCDNRNASHSRDESDEKISSWGDPGEYSPRAEGALKLGDENGEIRDERGNPLGKITKKILTSSKDRGEDCENPTWSHCVSGVGEKISNRGDPGEDSPRVGIQYEEINSKIWNISKETIGPGKSDKWVGVNVWLKKSSGMRWLQRIQDEGLVLQYHFGMFDQLRAKDDTSPLEGVKNTFDTLRKAAQRSGHELKLVRKIHNETREELIICPSIDDSMKLTWFLEEGMVKLSKNATPTTVKKVGYNDILKTRGTHSK